MRREILLINLTVKLVKKFNDYLSGVEILIYINLYDKIKILN